MYTTLYIYIYILYIWIVENRLRRGTEVPQVGVFEIEVDVGIRVPGARRRLPEFRKGPSWVAILTNPPTSAEPTPKSPPPFLGRDRGRARKTI